MQQLVLKNSQHQFATEVNALLMDGWRVVPGTMYATSFEAMPRKDTLGWFIMPNGKTVNTLFAVVLENPEVS